MKPHFTLSAFQFATTLGRLCFLVFLLSIHGFGFPNAKLCLSCEVDERLPRKVLYSLCDPCLELPYSDFLCGSGSITYKGTYIPLS